MRETLAFSLHESGRNPEAIEQLQHALRGFEAKFGADHARVERVGTLVERIQTLDGR